MKKVAVQAFGEIRGWFKITGKLFLFVGRDYFIRALQRTRLANQFTIGAKPAVIYIEDCNHFVTHNERSATADTYAKTAAVAPGGIKYGNSRQLKNLF